METLPTEPFPSIPGLSTRHKRWLFLGAALLLLALLWYLLRRLSRSNTRLLDLERDLGLAQEENTMLNELLNRQNDTLMQLREALGGEPNVDPTVDTEFEMPPYNFGLGIKIQPLAETAMPTFRAWGKATDRYVLVTINRTEYACVLRTSTHRALQERHGSHKHGQPDMKKIGAEIRQLLEMQFPQPSQPEDLAP